MIDFFTGIYGDIALDIAGRIIKLVWNKGVSARHQEDTGRNRYDKPTKSTHNYNLKATH